jgi:putative glutamine amidotransferase
LIGFVAGYDEDRPFFEGPAALLRAGGANLVFLAHTADQAMIEDYLALVDAVVIGGGVEDISPKWYGETPNGQCGPLDPVRDCFDLALVRWCAETDTPLLGICRGAQAINVALGGTLHQDVCGGAVRHDGGWTTMDDFRVLPHRHAVRFEPTLRARAGCDEAEVTSYHHQGIKDLGAGLRATSHAPDGLVESVESVRHRFLVGVQWHPELDPEAAVNRAIVADFIAQTNARRAAARRPRQQRPAA